MSEDVVPKVGDVITQDGPVPLREVLKILMVLIDSHDPECRGNDGIQLALDAVLSDPRVINKRSRPRKTSMDPAARLGRRIPDDFTMTPAMREWAISKYWWVNPEEQTEQFIDYWKSTPGARATKLDWGLTWKNWIRTSASRAPARNRTPPPQKPRTAAEMIPPFQGPSWYDDPAFV